MPMFGPGEKVPVAGLKISVVPSVVLPLLPPTTSTRPSASGAAADKKRTLPIEPVGLNDPEPAAPAACGASRHASSSEMRTKVPARSSRIGRKLLVLPPGIIPIFVIPRRGAL